MPYSVLFKPSARKSLLKLTKPVRKRLVEAAGGLADDPRPDGVTKLKGDENLWRIRVGSYRLVYENHDRRLVVLVVRVGDRKDIYR